MQIVFRYKFMVPLIDSIDNEFILVRYLDNNRAIRNVFLKESHSSRNEAVDLLDSILIALKTHNLEDTAKKNITGLKTDGESANTGKNSGLWVIFLEHLKKKYFVFGA